MAETGRYHRGLDQLVSLPPHFCFERADPI
jgi:hypothetical protein